MTLDEFPVEIVPAHCYMPTMSERTAISALMNESGVKFGTSGARGLVQAMTDRVCFAYTLAFLQHLSKNRGLPDGSVVFVAGDRRPSTPRIMEAVARAAAHLGYPVENCGLVPSPAVALRGLAQSGPAIMVTGSHIPDDRNGIKFNTSEGEIGKADEMAIFAMEVSLPELFDLEGAFLQSSDALGQPVADSGVAYRQRYLDAFPKNCLNGVRLGVYGHSAVGRELLLDLYRALGAEVVPLGFSDRFIPVDTEAIRSEDVVLARDWAKESSFTAIVSTDGDSDRPLVADERGNWVRGDIAGIITARFLRADAVSTPVSSNTAVESCGSFSSVIRTKIGSPFVIEGMKQAARSGKQRVVGYEANGGFLTANDLVIPGGALLSALPTRDAVIVHLALVLAARSAGKSLSQLAFEVAPRVTASDRDPSFASDRSMDLMSHLRDAPLEQLSRQLALGTVRDRDQTDGLRLTFESGEIVHLRPSGNAPELRCYSEADSKERAVELVCLGLAAARRLAGLSEGS